MASTQNKQIDYDDPKYRVTPFQQAAASCTGAVLTSVLMTPLDVVKIRLQAQQKATNNCFLYCNGLVENFCSQCSTIEEGAIMKKTARFNGTLDAFIKISKTEGITSLWSGLSPTLLLSIPATIAYFVTYEQLRLRLKGYYNRNRLPGEKLVQPYWIPLISGASARVISVTVVNPLELVRTKMQSQKISYLEIREALAILLKTDGILGLWRGILPTYMRDVPFSAIYWMNYETIKSFLGVETPSLGQSFVGGAISGSVAAAITVPFDVVKTHQQIEFGIAKNNLNGASLTPHKSAFTVFKDIYRSNGIRGLYAGIIPRLMKVAPACAIMISSFEYGKVFFNRLAIEQTRYVTGVSVTSREREANV